MPPENPGKLWLEHTATTTPGRPKDSGSRQQTQPDQNTQTGSPKRDKEAADRANAPKAPVQAGQCEVRRHARKRPEKMMPATGELPL
jgi:hypothetical protein